MAPSRGPAGFLRMLDDPWKPKGDPGLALVGGVMKKPELVPRLMLNVKLALYKNSRVAV